MGGSIIGDDVGIPNLGGAPSDNGVPGVGFPLDEQPEELVEVVEDPDWFFPAFVDVPGDDDMDNVELVVDGST